MTARPFPDSFLGIGRSEEKEKGRVLVTEACRAADLAA